MYNRYISLVAGITMIVPVVVVAQTDQQELIRLLTQQAGQLQAQLDKLRQATSSPPSQLSQQLTDSSGDFLKKLLEQTATSSTSNTTSSGDFLKLLQAKTVQQEDRPSPMAASFDRDLSFGMRNNADVSNLQEFLTDQGVYSGTISGNFFALTRVAVKKFQQAHGIKPNGYFGPATRAAANDILKNGKPSDRFYLVPSSMRLAIGQSVSVKAYYQPSMSSCPPGVMCKVTPPQEVQALLTSGNAQIAAVDELIRDCASPPPGIIDLCLPQYSVRGIATGSATITASYTTGEGTFTAKMNVTVVASAPSPQQRGTLSIVPVSANLAIGEQVGIQAYYQQPAPACLKSNPPCALGMMEPSPEKVYASFVSDNPNVAAIDKIDDKTCAPPRMCPVSIPKYAVRGVSAGSAIVTASYTNGSDVYTATMMVRVYSSVGSAPAY